MGTHRERAIVLSPQSPRELGQLSDWPKGMEPSRIYSGTGKGEDSSLSLASSLTSFPEQIQTSTNRTMPSGILKHNTGNMP